jgi:hypothetical protein
MIKINAVIYLEHQYPQSDLDDPYPGKTFGQKCIHIYIYIYERVVVSIKDNTYFSKFSLWLARSPCVSNICIYLHSRDPHEVWYSLNNGGHNISFGKCTRGLTILDPKFR